MHEALKKLVEKTRIAVVWILSILVIALCAWDCFAQSTPDWRPINRVYKNDGVTVGSIGSAGQIKAGHILTVKSFPAAIATDNTKLAYWNLNADANDELGVSAHNLVNGTTASGCNAGGTVAYTGANIFGSSNAAAAFNATPNSTLCSTDAFFNAGDSDFSVGGWFSLVSWAATSKILISQDPVSASDSGWFIGTGGTANTIELRVPTSASGSATFVVLSNSWLANEWHHVVLTYNATSDAWTVFVDGGNVFSTIQTNRTMTSPIFRISGFLTVPTNWFNGVAEDLFYAKAVLTSQDVRRLYSTRLDHNKNLIAKRQDWHFKHQHLGTVGNPYQTLPFVWHDLTDANSLFVDFSDLDATDKIDIRLYDLQQ